MTKTFKGGVHPKFFKESTFASPIDTLEAPQYLVFPLSQHIGAECVPLVNVGERVLLGQKIADSQSFISAPIHSSVSGRVIAIEPRYTYKGFKVMSIIIENDYMDTVKKDPIIHYDKPIENLSSDEIMHIVREAGIIGMGGAGFPTHAKLKSVLDSKITDLVINGAECEPFITADHRAMIEYPRPIFKGIKLIMQCLGLSKAYIAIESNKEDAIATMKTVCEGSGIEVVELKTKYPQGGEKQLIKAVCGREVPPGKLPGDAGCAVFNVDTCAAISRAVNNHMPLIKRIVTVSGPCVKYPRNLLVRLGTPAIEVINFCGGFSKEPEKIVVGGPMMGSAIHTLDIPITKTTSSLLAFDRNDEYYPQNPTCIRCGKCVDACPVNLIPVLINQYALRLDYRQCEDLNVSDCIECGACAYICPGRLPLVQVMKLAKLEVNKRKKNEQNRGGLKNE